MLYQFYHIKNNRVEILSVISVTVIAISFLFTSPIMNSTFASTVQPLLTATPGQMLIKNNTGTIILEGTVIDGTGSLPKPNISIVINGSRIAYLFAAANNYDLDSSAAQNVINLTGKYIIPGLFDMHAHVANVRKNSYNQS